MEEGDRGDAESAEGRRDQQCSPKFYFGQKQNH